MSQVRAQRTAAVPIGTRGLSGLHVWIDEQGATSEIAIVGIVGVIGEDKGVTSKGRRRYAIGILMPTRS